MRRRVVFDRDNLKMKIIEEDQILIGTADLDVDEIFLEVKYCTISELDKEVLLTDLWSQFINDIPELTPGYEIVAELRACGSEVKGLDVGSTVIGFVPFEIGGLNNFLLCKYSDVILVPLLSDISSIDALSILLPGLKSYNSIKYKFRLKAGDSLLILGSIPDCLVALQVAASWGAHIFIVAQDKEVALLFQSLKINNLVIWDQSVSGPLTVDNLMKLTNNIGVDFILDQNPNYEINVEDIVKMVAPHGVWATTRNNIQFDQCFSSILNQKGSTMSFLSPFSWVLAPNQQGRLLHVISDLLKKMNDGQIKPVPFRVYSMQEDILNDILARIINKSIQFSERIIIDFE